MAGLDFERFGIGGNVILLELLIDDLVTVARHASLDGRPAFEHDDIRQTVAELAVEVEVAKAFIDDHVERLIAGADQVGDGSIAKLSFAETYHRVSAYGANSARRCAPWPPIRLWGRRNGVCGNAGCGHARTPYRVEAMR